jgi:peptidoglycan/LPS O-acetylase OafA/YrhL
MSAEDRDRDEYVDTCRGVACVLLVAYHAIGASVGNGLHLAGDSFWRNFADGLTYFRMPMFSFLSGVVYAWRPFTAGNGKHFLLGKMRRLLVPMLVVGTTFAFVQSITPGVNVAPANWATLHILPVGHYWFSESLFIIFMVVMTLESLHLLEDLRKFLIVLASAAIMQLTLTPPPEFSLYGANYLFPFFLCGLGCSRFRIAKFDFLPICLAVLAGTSSYVIAGILGYVPRTDRTSVVALLLGVSACLSLLMSGWKNRTLASIGFYSYAIYLFHVFFTASTRMFLYSMNFKNVTALIAVATTAGVVGPILVEKIADRFALTRMLLLGKAGQATSSPRATSGRTQEPASGGASEVSITAGSIFRSAVVGFATLRRATRKKSEKIERPRS